MLQFRKASLVLLVGLFVWGGCGDDSREVVPHEANQGGSPLVPTETGGMNSGGTAASSGGRVVLGAGGEPTNSGSGGLILNLGGMGGAGGRPQTPMEPPIESCEPLSLAPPRIVCPDGPFEALPLIEGEVESILCTREMDVDWAEGPIWSAENGTLYFSNFDEADVAGFFNGDLMTYREGEGCRSLFSDVGTNGMAWATGEALLVGRQTNRTLSHVDLRTGEICSIVDQYDGKRFSSPNDVAVRSDGNIYFTDPAWNLGRREEELPQSLYRIAPNGALSLVAIYPDQRPNGVSLSPDEMRLYVAIEGAIVLFDVSAGGELSNERDFVQGISVDGMAIDCAGNVYASTGHVYSPAGELLGEFWGGTNLAFGGADRQTLFITGHRRLTSLRVAIPGLPY